MNQVWSYVGSEPITVNAAQPYLEEIQRIPLGSILTELFLFFADPETMALKKVRKLGKDFVITSSVKRQKLLKLANYVQIALCKWEEFMVTERLTLMASSDLCRHPIIRVGLRQRQKTGRYHLVVDTPSNSFFCSMATLQAMEFLSIFLNKVSEVTRNKSDLVE